MSPDEESRLRAEFMERLYEETEDPIGTSVDPEPIGVRVGLDLDSTKYVLVEHLVRAGFLVKDDYDGEVRLTQAGAREVEKARSLTIKPNTPVALNQLRQELAHTGLPDTLLGTDWSTVARRCADILTAAVDATSRLQKRAPSLNPSSARPRNEYDVQNLFFLVLRPWLPDLEINPFQIRYGGQDKSADLAASRSTLVIEAKFVSDSSSAAAVVKQLSGLGEFYAQAARVKAVIFAIVIADEVSWDSVKIDHDFSNLTYAPVVVTRSIRLPKYS